MWNGAPGSSTSSAASSAAANGSTSVNAPSLVACMWAKSSTGRTQPSRLEISSTSSRLPISRTRPITSIPNGTARSLASSRSRSSPSCSQIDLIAAARVRPSRKPGWKTTGSAPAAFAIPAEWSSIPIAMLQLLAALGVSHEAGDRRVDRQGDLGLLASRRTRSAQS